MNIPSYRVAFRLKHPGISDHDIERSILRGWKSEWSIDRRLGPTKRSWAFHMLRYMRLLYPKRFDLHPWVRRQVKAIEVAYWMEGRKLINVIGSQSSSKTFTAAAIGLAILSLDPSMSVIYAASPFKVSAESALWGRIKATFNMMDKSIFPAARAVEDRVYLEQHPHAGYVELKVIDKVASLQGAKQADETGKRGFIVVLADEVALFRSVALKEVLANIMSNSRIIVLTGCNFQNVDGLEGDLCKPEGREYASLDIETDQYWRSVMGGFTLRLDGHRSPNIRYGSTKWQYLFTAKRRAELERDYGLQGPKYLEQARSWPNTSAGSMTVITRSELTAHGCFDDEIVWNQHERTKVAFCDPAWGGDNAVIQAYEFGRAEIFDSTGRQVPIIVFKPICHPETLKLVANMPLDVAWQARFEAAIRGKPYYRDIGKLVTFDQQIVVQSYEFLMKHGIPLRNFGYDTSMRGSIVNEFSAIIGGEVVPIDPLGKATERSANTRGDKAEDLYMNFLTETWFAVGDVARSGQLRGAQMLTSAISQLVRRSYKNQGAKKKMESKQEYKASAGSSPDHADTLVGGLEMARRRGFVIAGRRTPSETPGSILEHLKGLRTSVGHRIHRLSSDKL